MRGQIKVFILKALLRAGEPYTRTAVITAVQASLGPQALVSDVLSCLGELAGDGYVAEERNRITNEVSYGLTTAGALAVKGV